MKAAEEHRLKDREYEKKLADMGKQVTDLQRKLDEGPQQTVGEVQELELEDILHANFQFDSLEPVPKGVRGGDILQGVRNELGRECGTILWESKRTKNWSDGWIQKLKDDQRAAKADLAVIFSAVLPKNLNNFGFVEGVWVTDFSSIVGLATTLRTNLIQLAQARSALIGKSDKMELLYNYLSGPEFKRRVEAIAESFIAMKQDLDAERRATEKAWAKREKQIYRIVQNTAGMYGDLQGITGATLPELKILELPSAEAGKDEEVPF